jgi:hypothetical protein
VSGFIVVDCDIILFDFVVVGLATQLLQVDATNMASIDDLVELKFEGKLLALNILS